jgi:hypothetical protein
MSHDVPGYAVGGCAATVLILGTLALGVWLANRDRR